MKKVLSMLLVLLPFLAPAQENTRPIAFPGAEGGGMYATGGRGGKVLYVTRLEDDDKPGSLRWAVAQKYPRTILFKVSGEIALQKRLTISSPDVTIAGQSAPGDGICISNFGLQIKADNVVIRFIRLRMGDRMGLKAKDEDAMGAKFVRNVMVDHCSMSWSTDECASFYGCLDFTLQWCVIAESLRISQHEKGKHGYGGIWGGKNASFHHNLLACHDSRNPRFDHPFIYTPETLAEFRGPVDMRNNVIYNWGSNSTYGGEDGEFNMVGNYYKPGPATPASKTGYFIQGYGKGRDVHVSEDEWTDFHYPYLYMKGNAMEGNPAITADNTKGITYASNGGLPGKNLDSPLLINGLAEGHTTTHTARQAFDLVLRYAGASLERDDVDNRICADAFNGTATVKQGGRGSVNGLIDTPEAAGGWPVYNSLPAPEDSDGDGMPDGWEVANGLDPNDPADGNLSTLTPPYSNLEVYLNSLAGKVVSVQNGSEAAPAKGKVAKGKKK